MSIQVLKVLNLKGSEAHKGHHSSGHPLPRQCPWSAHGHWSSWSWWNVAADLKKLTLMWLKKMRQLINLANILVHSHLFQIVSQIFPWRGLGEQATMEEYIKWVSILANKMSLLPPIISTIVMKILIRVCIDSMHGSLLLVQMLHHELITNSTPSSMLLIISTNSRMLLPPHSTRPHTGRHNNFSALPKQVLSSKCQKDYHHNITTTTTTDINISFYQWKLNLVRHRSVTLTIYKYILKVLQEIEVECGELIQKLGFSKVLH